MLLFSRLVPRSGGFSPGARGRLCFSFAASSPAAFGKVRLLTGEGFLKAKGSWRQAGLRRDGERSRRRFSARDSRSRPGENKLHHFTDQRETGEKASSQISVFLFEQRCSRRLDSGLSCHFPAVKDPQTDAAAPSRALKLQGRAGAQHRAGTGGPRGPANPMGAGAPLLRTGIAPPAEGRGRDGAVQGGHAGGCGRAPHPHRRVFPALLFAASRALALVKQVLISRAWV